MADKIKLATIEAGGTWGRMGNWLAAGLKPAGFEVELLKQGAEIPETAYRVDSREADLSVTTTFGAREAYLGKPPYDKKTTDQRDRRNSVPESLVRQYDKGTEFRR